MSVTLVSPPAAETDSVEQRFAIGGVRWDFGANADRMRGGENYDFAVDPPPDLAIEVEASHPADDAVETWGRMSVPEIWRFQAATNTCTFWKRRDDTSYEQIDESMFLPKLTPDDVTESIAVARSSGTVPWLAGLPAWIDRVIRPRLERRDEDGVV